MTTKKQGEKNDSLCKIAIATFVILLVWGLSKSVKATQVGIDMNYNGTGQFGFIWSNEHVKDVQQFEVNGTGFIKIVYDDGSEDVQTLANYIAENEANWDNNNDPAPQYGGAMTYKEFFSMIGDITSYLMGMNRFASDEIKNAGNQLNAYFASKNDIYILNAKIDYLMFRVKALEKLADDNYSEGYCKAKLEIALQYNMTTVKCGNTTYTNHQTNSNGEDIFIGITPAE